MVPKSEQFYAVQEPEWTSGEQSALFKTNSERGRQQQGRTTEEGDDCHTWTNQSAMEMK